MDIGSLSIVIPTLGGKSLNTVIEHVNSGDKKPGEILICIPANLKRLLNVEQFKNVRIIETKKGQVTQRIEGFKNSKKKICAATR